MVARLQALPSLRAVDSKGGKPTLKLYGLETGKEANRDLPVITSSVAGHYGGWRVRAAALFRLGTGRQWQAERSERSSHPCNMIKE